MKGGEEVCERKYVKETAHKRRAVQKGSDWHREEERSAARKRQLRKSQEERERRDEKVRSSKLEKRAG